jgi:hypothetical protein
MAVWVYKCNTNPNSVGAYGDWRDFFDDPRAHGFTWGGDWSMNSPISLRILKEELKPGDYIFCYQTNRKELVGLCRFERFARGDDGRDLRLKILERFDPPVKIHALKKVLPVLREVKAFKSGPIQTLYHADSREARILFSACGIPPRKYGV